MLGIDVGSYAIKIASGKMSGKKAIVDKFVSEELPDELKGGKADILSLQQIVNRLIRQVGVEKNVVLAIPTSTTVIRSISVDGRLSGDELEGEVQMALVNIVPFPLEQVSFDFLVLGKDKKDLTNNEVLVVASRNEVIERAANLVDNKAIKQKSIDVEAFAFSQIIEGMKGSKYHEFYGVIDIGYRLTRIYVLAADDLIYSRELQVGGQHLTELLAETLGIGFREAESLKKSDSNIFAEYPEVLNAYLENLVEQMVLAIEIFESANAGVQVAEFFLTGGGALPHGINKRLSAAIKPNTVRPLDLGENFKIAKRVKPTDYINNHCLAVGLSLRK